MRRLRSADAAAVAVLLALAVVAGCRRQDEPAATVEPAAGPHPLADAYLQVAFGNRWGAPPAMLRKWTRPVTLRVGGEPRYEDRTHLRRLVAELAALPGMVDLHLAEWEPGPADLEVHYLPTARFAELAAGWDGDYAAYYECRAGADGALEHGLILLPMDDAFPQYMRDNLLLEGVVACLGLAGGLERADDSVFHAGPNWYETSLTPLDRRLIALHCRDELAAGLTRAEAARRLGLASGPA